MNLSAEIRKSAATVSLIGSVEKSQVEVNDIDLLIGFNKFSLIFETYCLLSQWINTRVDLSRTWVTTNSIITPFLLAQNGHKKLIHLIICYDYENELKHTEVFRGKEQLNIALLTKDIVSLALLSKCNHFAKTIQDALIIEITRQLSKWADFPERKMSGHALRQLTELEMIKRSLV
jgi:hypothetical protein